MKYSFDTIIPRENTNCLKYDLREQIFGKKDVIPLWVADMDFKIANEIIEDITKAANHGIYGYTFLYDSLYESLISWNAKRNNWIIKKDEIHFYHGIVPSINLLIETLTLPGDSIIIQTPVYFPFFQSIENQKRVVLNNELVLKNGSYTMNFEALEKSINSHTKMMILCHPHNPVGRNWMLEELMQLHDICKKHNIIVVSDEIHSDIIHPPHKHIPWATLSDYAAENSITLTAPSKTFNIAGLSLSAIISKNRKYHHIISDYIKQKQLHGINLLGMAAFESAYTKGEVWLEELLVYLQGNIELISSFAKKWDKIDLIKPEATYLAWLDCRKLQITDKELRTFMIEKAGVGLSDGFLFGKGGEGFMRLNFACPRSILVEAIEKIDTAISKL